MDSNPFWFRPVLRDFPRGGWDAKAEAKSNFWPNRVSEAWRKDWKPQSDAATSLDCRTLSFSLFLEKNVVGSDQQLYGMEQQRARNQPGPLPRLLICGHRIVNSPHDGLTTPKTYHCSPVLLTARRWSSAFSKRVIRSKKNQARQYRSPFLTVGHTQNS